MTNLQASGGLAMSWGDLILGAGVGLALTVISLIAWASIRTRRQERRVQRQYQPVSRKQETGSDL